MRDMSVSSSRQFAGIHTPLDKTPRLAVSLSFSWRGLKSEGFFFFSLSSSNYCDQKWKNTKDSGQQSSTVRLRSMPRRPASVYLHRESDTADRCKCLISEHWFNLNSDLFIYPYLLVSCQQYDSWICDLTPKYNSCLSLSFLMYTYC